ncbi:hypothetical protein CVT24_007546 [Panaeolus cyanescens]|uniref:ATP-dependent DNA helicase n=1 Tax=Panaeolus cyanescens TaxID=181874 RepID=A0A409WZU1_9AGAR|nr:hypothetical protein CVT24_007546 [Panaeolus cyanescens]
MVGQKCLSLIDSRLRLAKGQKLPFGGVHVSLIGDFSQLAPVGDIALYAPNPSEQLALKGSILYTTLFTKSFHLKVVHRRRREEDNLRSILASASNGALSVAEWELLIARSEGYLSEEEQQQFMDATYLFSERKKAKHIGSGASRASSDEAMGLAAIVRICRGARVMITRNLSTPLGLVNGAVGIVEDIVWGDDGSPNVILVSLPNYCGETLWRTEPRKDHPDGIPIVPITPVTVFFEHSNKTLSRTQFPVCLAWALTIHKAQSLTMDKIKLGLGPREFSFGLTFVALSRVRSLDDIMLVEQLDYQRVSGLGGNEDIDADRRRRYF